MAAGRRFRQEEVTAYPAKPRSVGLVDAGSVTGAVTLLLLCATPLDVYAKDRACRDIESSTARLACYDLASPPKPQQRVITETDPSRPAYRDPFVDESAKTAARLKGICRGC